MAAAAAVIWGTAWVATGIVLRDLSPEGVAAWRGVGSLLLILPLLWLPAARHDKYTGSAEARPASGRIGRYLVLAFLGGPWFVLGMAFAVHLTGATISAFVAGLYPVFAAVAAPLLLPDRASLAAIGGLLIAFAGIVLLAGFDPLGLPLVGIAVALAVAACFALFLLLARRWSRPWGLSPLKITAANLVLLSVVALPLAWLVSDRPLVPAAGVDTWLSIGWLILGPGVLANVFVLGSVRRLPAHESSAYLMLSPLTAALLAAWLLGEWLAPAQMAGAALVLAGIGAATLPLSRLPGLRRWSPQRNARW